MADANLNVGFRVTQNDIPPALRANAESARNTTQSFEEWQNSIADAMEAQQAQTAATRAAAEASEREIATLNQNISAQQRLREVVMLAAQGKLSLTQATREEVDAALAEQKATAENIALYDKLTNSTARASEGHESMRGNARAMREAAMMLGVALNLLGNEIDQNLGPQAKQLTETMRLGADGMMLGSHVAGVQGAAYGALAGIILGLAFAASEGDAAVKELNKDLQSASEKDKLAETLAKISGANKEQSQAALDAAHNNAEYAKDLQAASEATKHDTNVWESFITAAKTAAAAISDLVTGGFKQLAEAASAAFTIITHGTVTLESTAVRFEATMAGIKAYADAYAALKSPEEAAADANKAYADTLDRVANAKSHLNEVMAGAPDPKAAQEMSQNTANTGAAKSELYKADDAYQSHLDDIADQQKAKAAANAQEIERMNRTHRENLVRMADTELARENDLRAQEAQREDDLRAQETIKEEDMAQSRQNSIDDLAQSDLNAVNASLDAKVKAEDQAAQKTLDIEKKLQTEITALDYDTGMKLRTAKTEHDAEAIEFTAAHEKAVKNSAASDAINQEQRTLQSALTAEDQKLAKTRETEAQRLDVINRNADQALARARRDEENQIEMAQRTRDQQIQAAQVALDAQIKAENLRNKNAFTDFDSRIKLEESAQTNSEDKVHRQYMTHLDELKQKLNELIAKKIELANTPMGNEPKVAYYTGPDSTLYNQAWQ